MTIRFLKFSRFSRRLLDKVTLVLVLTIEVFSVIGVTG
jgi:hypothetical protein